ncbi:MAG: hypothetical protein HW405_670 [Candidatus Berkelbacteria bacterium]|nr:hypothetical protein [Candidatus Berkelbacteria bacterium]
MTITPHFLAGSAVATAATSNIFVAFLLGFITHFILDAIPHLDPGTFHHLRIPGYKKEINLEIVHAEDKPWPEWIYVFVAVEFIITALIVILLFKDRSNFEVIIAGGFGGIFVDAMDNPVFNFVLKWPVFRQIHWLHHRAHHNLDPKKWYWGLPVQLIIIGGAIWYLLKF